jgi:hypothetical protein
MTNWDTQETWNWITNDDGYKNALEDMASIGNELLFIAYLPEFIMEINLQLEKENQIDTKNVNGNEIYVAFCEMIGNEQQGWCRNEK